MFGMLTALATGLGAVPLIILKNAAKMLAPAQVIAASLMTVASFCLVKEALGNDADYLTPLFGFIAGFFLIMMAGRLRNAFPQLPGMTRTESGSHHQCFLIIFVMTLHSIAEGVGIGVSFGGGEYMGEFISLTIALHNIPEGLAISLIAVPNGMSVWNAGLWSIFTSLPQPLIGVLAYLFVNMFSPLLSLGLGFAAGAMIWMVICELLPGAARSISLKPLAAIFMMSGVTFFALMEMI